MIQPLRHSTCGTASESTAVQEEMDGRVFSNFNDPGLEYRMKSVGSILSRNTFNDPYGTMCRPFPDCSPMTQSYLLMMKLAVIEDISIFAGTFLGVWIFAAEKDGAAVMTDLIVAFAAASYMIYCAMDTLARNFRSLVDMPLPETDQRLIIHALTETSTPSSAEAPA